MLTSNSTVFTMEPNLFGFQYPFKFHEKVTNSQFGKFTKKLFSTHPKDKQTVCSGATAPPPYFADQLTLFELGRADYPHLLLLAPPMFFTFRHHWHTYQIHTFFKTCLQILNIEGVTVVSLFVAIKHHPFMLTKHFILCS